MARTTTRVRVRLLFEPRDLWVGLYWRTGGVGGLRSYTFYLCLVPMLPIRVRITRIRWQD